ncbi:MAG: hypothetical protein PHD05_09900 [Sphaerochaetaceae bacterium]|nr:hypothetical protein [Sphaerochaetaceae bacterium]
MKVTRTTNSDLSRRLPLSSSYISRLRNGKRSLPKIPAFLPNLVNYFVDKLTQENWKDIGFDEIPENKEKTLEKWFLEKAHVFPSDYPKESKKTFDCYFGNEGKRLLVIRFFEDVMKIDKKQTLLLYSNENMEWLLSDPVFFDAWQKYLVKILKLGNSIIIIHNLNRNLNEMYESLKKWVPLYMTGGIKPYFCNHLRDGIFQQSFFIAPESGAILSSSVKDNTEKMPNFYFHSIEIINSLIREYKNFLKISSSFLICYKEENQAVKDFFICEGPIFTVQPGFSLPTLPEDALKGMNEEYILCWRIAVKNFKASLKKEKVSDLGQLYTPQEINEGVLLPFSGIFSFNRLYYTKESYLLHLKSILEFFIKYENYDFKINERRSCLQTYLVKENQEFLVCENTISSFMFHVKKPELVSSIWEILNHNISHSKVLLKEDKIEILKNTIADFESSIVKELT